MWFFKKKDKKKEEKETKKTNTTKTEKTQDKVKKDDKVTNAEEKKETKNMKENEEKETKVETKERKSVYRVVYDRENRVWLIKKDGAKRVIASFATKDEALKRVKELCESQNLKVIVHKKDGKFQKKWGWPHFFILTRYKKYVLNKINQT